MRVSCSLQYLTIERNHINIVIDVNHVLADPTFLFLSLSLLYQSFLISYMLLLGCQCSLRFGMPSVLETLAIFSTLIALSFHRLGYLGTQVAVVK